eukprot:m.38018 g.38018  ORF g.38018 m.38018 type:complete len:559 (+) comp12568_c0_seq1:101-1777(+)
MLFIVFLASLAASSNAAALPRDLSSPENDLQLGSAPTLDDIDFIASGDGNAGRARRAIDSSDRASVTSGYKNDYLTTSNDFYSWSGQVSPQCTPNPANGPHDNQVLQRVNFYRAMVGLPAVTLDSSFSNKCRKAALVFTAENILTHYLNSSMACHNADAELAAKKSNIGWGSHGVDTINGYIDDYGGYNTAVGHRRWILYPKLASIGNGDAGDGSSGAPYGNCLYVIGSTTSRTVLPFVAWPSKGYFPYQLLPSSRRWSFSVPSADFSAANVTIDQDGDNVPLQFETVVNGYGDNTLVFVVPSVYGRPSDDTTYTVSVTYKISGVTTTTTYDVTVFDPIVSGPVIPCKTLRVSGRQGTNSIINGVYEHGGYLAGISYYTKPSSSFTLKFDGGAWGFSSSLQSGSYYAIIQDSAIRPEDTTSPVIVWTGSWQADPNVAITCDEYFPSSSTAAPTTSMEDVTTSTTAAPTTSMEDVTTKDVCDDVFQRSTKKKCKKACKKRNLTFLKWHENGSRKTLGCARGCVCCPDRTSNSKCAERCNNNYNWQKKRFDGCKRVCECL